MRLATLLATTLALATVAAAQSSTTTTEDEGCTRSDPCPWVLDVDGSGFEYQPAQVNYTAGDWYEIMVFNNDPDASHTVSLSGHSKSITVAADGFATDTGAFELKAGTWELKDSPSNDTVRVNVLTEDSVGAETSAAGNDDDKGAPALPFVVLGAALLLAVALRRR